MIMSIKGKSLALLVLKFRKAIEAAKNENNLEEFFIKFPVGQCGNTSDLLAQYLIENGYNSIVYVNGTYYGDEYEHRYAHTWLIVEEMVVDITGDQFKYYSKPLFNDTPVYIGPMTKWYKLFEIGPQGKLKHYGLEKSWIHYRKLRDCYDIILKYIP